MRFLLDLVIFAVGAGLGIWWGVSHPAEAQNVAAREQAAVAQAKIEVLEKFMGTTQPDQRGAEFQQMLDQEKQKLQDAKSKLDN
jgi:hypothetical protein